MCYSATRVTLHGQILEYYGLFCGCYYGYKRYEKHSMGILLRNARWVDSNICRWVIFWWMLLNGWYHIARSPFQTPIAIVDKLA